MRKFLFAGLLCLLLCLCLLPAAAEAGYYIPEEGIVSAYYPIDRENGFLTGVIPGTEPGHLLAVCLPGDVRLSADTLATGTVLTAGTGEALQTLTVIVTGDLNGDGAVTITDMLMIKSSILGQELPDTAAAAGDINYDGAVTVTDFLRVKACLLGMGQIEAACPQNATEWLLLTPGATAAWQCEAVDVYGYISSEEELVVDDQGMLTAPERECSAFVYAVDAEGNVLERLMVTVLQEPLKVSFREEKVRLQMGTTLALKPVFNHPLTPAITWSSADPQVVIVDDQGLLTAQHFGVTTVTATLENGSTAQAEVTVAPPITGLSFERNLYKLKPGTTRKLSYLVTPADTGEELIWSSSNEAVAKVASDGTVTGVKNGTVTVKVTGKYSGLSASCQVKICNVKQVAMTFDDGPSDHTGKLLDFLKENDIPVTFFLVGNRMNSYKDIVKREVAEGHEVGYHSYSHKEQTTLSSAQITSDFEKADRILRNLTGEGFTVWRTPGGGYNSRVLNAVPLPHIMWSVDTLDWKTLNTYSVYNAVKNQARDGSIILLHDLHRTSVEGSIMAMKEMLAGDYEFLTVTELLSRDGTPPVNCKSYFNG